MTGRRRRPGPRRSTDGWPMECPPSSPGCWSPTSANEWFVLPASRRGRGVRSMEGADRRARPADPTRADPDPGAGLNRLPGRRRGGPRPAAGVSGHRGVVRTALAHLFDTGHVTVVEYSNVVKPGQVPMGRHGRPIPVIAQLVCADGRRSRWGGMVAGQGGPLNGGCGSRRL